MGGIHHPVIDTSAPVGSPGFSSEQDLRVLKELGDLVERLKYESTAKTPFNREGNSMGKIKKPSHLGWAMGMDVF